MKIKTTVRAGKKYSSGHFALSLDGEPATL